MKQRRQNDVFTLKKVWRALTCDKPLPPPAPALYAGIWVTSPTRGAAAYSDDAHYLEWISHYYFYEKYSFYLCAQGTF